MYNKTMETQKKHGSANAAIEIEVGRMENISDNTKEESQIAKYTVKDSVFTSLFKDKKYLLQLYRALHPEDKEMTEDQLTDITIKNILTDGMYNDLGFMAGDRLMILVEAQSTWTMNIIIRALMYLVQSYHDYFDREGADLYGSRKVKLPKPELYVIFTGERVAKPETVSLTEEFFGGEDCAIEVKVKMIYGDDAWLGPVSGEQPEKDIISQYITFTKVYNEQLKLYQRTRKTITETIRICKDRNILREYLSSREKEVVDIMMTLFDEERIMQTYVANKEKEAAKEAAKKTAIEAAGNMLKTGKLSVEEVAACFTELSIEDVRHLQEEMMQTV